VLEDYDEDNKDSEDGDDGDVDGCSLSPATGIIGIILKV
jgi:hypothetical protein